MMKDGNRLLIGCLCALGTEFVYGLSYVFIKTATNEASTFAILGWRFLIAAVAMTVLVLLGVVKVSLKGKVLRPLLLVALFDPALYYICETFGIGSTTATESGVILSCIPVASLVASTLILKERPSNRQIIGITVTLIGVLITVFAAGISSSFSVVGYLFLAAGVVVYALYSVFVEKAEGYTGIEITYIMMLVGALLFVPLALIENALTGSLGTLLTLPATNTAFLTSILYSSLVSSLVGFWLANTSISLIGVNRTSSFIGVSTVVSIIAGILFLGESFTMMQVLGAAVIIAGVYIANRR